jgi:hypothetical protein
MSGIDLDRLKSHKENIEAAAAVDEQAAKDGLQDVLYQKLGHDWFAFTEVDGEIHFARIEGSPRLTKHEVFLIDE